MGLNQSSKKFKKNEPPITTAVPITDNHERKLSQAQVVGLEDPESEVRRTLNVGKNMNWNEIEKVLLSTKDSVSFRYRALTLAHDKAPSKDQMVDLMERALKVQHESLLLRHEIAYFLGQAGNGKAMKDLKDLLHDEKEDDIVRHEAAEALWAVCCLTDGEYEALDDILKYCDHPSEPLSHTCKLVKQGMEAEMREEDDESDTKVPICACQSKIRVRTADDGSQYKSFDPAGVIPNATQSMIPELSKTLRDESKMLLERYRCMFTLRNLGGEKAVMALCKALETDKSSAIMRHEIAFVLGQMASMCDMSYKSIPCLTRILARTEEHGMVCRSCFRRCVGGSTHQKKKLMNLEYTHTHKTGTTRSCIGNRLLGNMEQKVIRSCVESFTKVCSR